jgi:hypothetical protein
MKWLTTALVCGFWLGVNLVCRGQTPAPAGDESARYQSEVVADGLDFPCGLVLSPDAASLVYFAESGAGKVLCFSPSSPFQRQVVVTGLAMREVAGTPPLTLGPTALGFLASKKLAVLGGVQKDGAEAVGVFLLSSQSKPLTADQCDQREGPLTTGTPGGRIGLMGCAFTEAKAFFSVGGEGFPGSLSQAVIAAERLETVQALVPPEEFANCRYPAGVAVVRTVLMEYLALACLGDTSRDRDSRLVFVAPSPGRVLMQLEPGLFDTVGVAASPSGQLYVVDFAWQEASAGGVFRIDDARVDGRPSCRAVKIASVPHPTSLAFAVGGAMYVTSAGADPGAKEGQILKLTGDF